MREQIFTQLIDLRNSVYDFCDKLSDTLLKPLKDSRLVVEELKQEFKEALCRAHKISIEEMCDIHIAHINKDGGQTQDPIGEKRELQGQLTHAIDQIRKDFQGNPDMRRVIDIIQLFINVNIHYSLDQLLAGSITQRNPLSDIMKNFCVQIRACNRLLQKIKEQLPFVNDSISHREDELTAIQERVNLIQQNLIGLSDLYIDLLEVLQKQYELNPTSENFDALINRYKKEDIERQFRGVQELGCECNNIQQRISDLQRRDRTFTSLTVTRGTMFAMPIGFEAEITRLRLLLTIHQKILKQFMDIIKSRTRPFDSETGVKNESYDSDAAYHYAVILLYNKEPNKATFYLDMYVKNNPTRLDYQLRAYCLLYIIFTNYPMEQGQVTTLQSYLNNAEALETVDNRTFGIGHYLHVLHNFSLINNILKQHKEIVEDSARTSGVDKREQETVHSQLPWQRNTEIMLLIAEIYKRCCAAANKGFDFRLFVNEITRPSNADRTITQLLFNAEMVHNLRSMSPATSSEYAKIFLALVCQNLGQIDLARRYLLDINHIIIGNENRMHCEITQYAQRKIEERYEHNISLALLNGICQQVQGAIEGPERIYQKCFLSILLDFLKRIYQAKQQNKNPMDFLNIIFSHLNDLSQHPGLKTCDQELLKSVIKQLINIIDSEYLIFSANPEKLENAKLRDVVIKLVKLLKESSIAHDCLENLLKPALPFREFYTKLCEERVAEITTQIAQTPSPVPWLGNNYGS